MEPGSQFRSISVGNGKEIQVEKILVIRFAAPVPHHGKMLAIRRQAKANQASAAQQRDDSTCRNVYAEDVADTGQSLLFRGNGLERAFGSGCIGTWDLRLSCAEHANPCGAGMGQLAGSFFGKI